MVILISLVAMGIYFLLLFAFLLFNKYGSRESKEKFNYIQNSTLYCMLMYVSLIVYFILILVIELNPLLNVLTLSAIIWITDKIAKRGLDEKYIDLFIRKKLIGVALVTIALLFFFLSVVDKNVEYKNNMYVAISIIIGYVVSLEGLLKKNSYSELKIIVDNEIKYLREIKVSMIVSFIMIILNTFMAFILTNMFGENMQVALYKGMAIGAILFVVIAMIVILNKKTNKYFMKIFFRDI